MLFRQGKYLKTFQTYFLHLFIKHLVLHVLVCDFCENVLLPWKPILFKIKLGECPNMLPSVTGCQSQTLYLRFYVHVFLYYV